MRCWRLIAVLGLLITSCSSVSIDADAVRPGSGDTGSSNSGSGESVSGQSATSTTLAPSSGTSSSPAEAPSVGFDLERVEVEIDDVFDDVHIFTALVPAGWERNDFVGVTFQPPEGSDYGFFTSIEFDNGCDGLCDPKDWATQLNNQQGILTRTRESGDEIITDEALENGWLIVTDGSINRTIQVYSWRNEASFYFTCEADLDSEDADLTADFTELCLAAEAHWLRS